MIAQINGGAGIPLAAKCWVSPTLADVTGQGDVRPSVPLVSRIWHSTRTGSGEPWPLEGRTFG